MGLVVQTNNGIAQNWEILESEYIHQSQWLVARKDKVKTTQGVVINDFYVLEYPTWVNIIAITNEGNYVIEHQYRHGIGQNVYEICAGTCEKREEPMAAARRELLEETGFGGGKWSLIGKYAPNPNSMNNWCYSFLAENVFKLQEPQQEQTECIEVIQVDKTELKRMMLEGKIVEGIMLAPLWQHLSGNIKI